MPSSLRLVRAEQQHTADSLFQEAVLPLPAGVSGAAILARAVSLARNTVQVMRREQEPAILASVALVIPDQAFKVAFLEAVGELLI